MTKDTSYAVLTGVCWLLIAGPVLLWHSRGVARTGGRHRSLTADEHTQALAVRLHAGVARPTGVPVTTPLPRPVSPDIPVTPVDGLPTITLDMRAPVGRGRVPVQGVHIDRVGACSYCHGHGFLAGCAWCGLGLDGVVVDHAPRRSRGGVS